MAKIDDGGPAYPAPAESERGCIDFVPRADGMSKREVYALHAMMGSLANKDIDAPATCEEASAIANGAFMMADAMIKAGAERG